MKKVLSIFLVIALALSLLPMSGCAAKKNYENGEVYVYNAGEYIDPEVIEKFEDEYSIHVIYDMFENNEDIFPQLEKGSIHYDAICPSDYMIEKLKTYDLLQEIDFNRLENYKNIKKYSISKLAKNNIENYAVPYMEGTVGILYNKTLLDEKNLSYPKSWADLWKEEYKGEILMQNNVRDGLMVALKKNGFSLNSKLDKELEIATYDLIEQKPLVQAYVIDQVRDKMISGEAAIGVIYSGECLYVAGENPDYEYKYVIPEEGTNVWTDAWVVPKDSQNLDNAYLWLDYMCRADIAKLNTEYITYETCNEEGKKLVSEDCILSGDIIEDYSNDAKNESYNYLGDAEEIYNDKWKRIKSE